MIFSRRSQKILDELSRNSSVILPWIIIYISVWFYSPFQNELIDNWLLIGVMIVLIFLARLYNQSGYDVLSPVQKKSTRCEGLSPPLHVWYLADVGDVNAKAYLEYHHFQLNDYPKVSEDDLLIFSRLASILADDFSNKLKYPNIAYLYAITIREYNPSKSIKLLKKCATRNYHTYAIYQLASLYRDIVQCEYIQHKCLLAALELHVLEESLVDEQSELMHLTNPKMNVPGSIYMAYVFIYFMEMKWMNVLRIMYAHTQRRSWYVNVAQLFIVYSIVVFVVTVVSVIFSTISVLLSFGIDLAHFLLNYIDFVINSINGFTFICVTVNAVMVIQGVVRMRQKFIYSTGFHFVTLMCTLSWIFAKLFAYFQWDVYPLIFIVTLLVFFGCWVFGKFAAVKKQKPRYNCDNLLTTVFGIDEKTVWDADAGDQGAIVRVVHNLFYRKNAFSMQTYRLVDEPIKNYRSAYKAFEKSERLQIVNGPHNNGFRYRYPYSVLVYTRLRIAYLNFTADSLDFFCSDIQEPIGILETLSAQLPIASLQSALVKLSWQSKTKHVFDHFDRIANVTCIAFRLTSAIHVYETIIRDSFVSGPQLQILENALFDFPGVFGIQFYESLHKMYITRGEFQKAIDVYGYYFRHEHVELTYCIRYIESIHRMLCADRQLIVPDVVKPLLEKYLEYLGRWSGEDRYSDDFLGCIVEIYKIQLDRGCTDVIQNLTIKQREILENAITRFHL